MYKKQGALLALWQATTEEGIERARLFRTKPKLLAEVEISVAIIYKFCSPQYHKANSDFLHSGEALKLV